MKSNLGIKSVAQQKCIYTNAHSVGKKQEEIHDIITTMGTQCVDSHDWSAALDGYKFFTRDRQGGRGVGVSLSLGSVSTLQCSRLGMMRLGVSCIIIKEKVGKASILRKNRSGR